MLTLYSKRCIDAQSLPITRARPTMDIDMLGMTSNEVGSICAQVADIISVETDDGLVFESNRIRGERIKEDADYEGVRVRFVATG